MKYSTLQRAVEDAVRFIAAAKRIEAGRFLDNDCKPGKNAAAAKRASLDLTRRLADLRQNR